MNSRRKFFFESAAMIVAPAVAPLAEAFQTPLQTARLTTRFVQRVNNTLGPLNPYMTSFPGFEPNPNIISGPPDKQISVVAGYKYYFETLFADPEIEALMLRAEHEIQGRYLPAIAARANEVDPGWADKIYSRERLKRLAGMSLTELQEKTKTSISDDQREKIVASVLAGYEKFKNAWLDLDLAIGTGATPDFVNGKWAQINSMFYSEILNANVGVDPNFYLTRLSAYAGTLFLPSPEERPQDLSIRMAGALYNIKAQTNPGFSNLPAMLYNGQSTSKIADRRGGFVNYYQRGFYRLYESSPSVYAELIEAEEKFPSVKNPVAATLALSSYIIKVNSAGVAGLYSSNQVIEVMEFIARQNRLPTEAIAKAAEINAAIIRPVLMSYDLGLALGMTGGQLAALAAERRTFLNDYFRSVLTPKPPKTQPGSNRPGPKVASALPSPVWEL